LLRQLSEPKPRVAFERPLRPLARRRFDAVVRNRGLRADRRTRMLYSGRMFAINGELIALPDREQRAMMAAFADRRSIPAGGRAAASRGTVAPLCEQIYQWYLAGWVHPPS
jgi:hypothetical protein